MTLWPVASRELQVAARRPLTFRVRQLAAVGAVSVLLLIVWQATRFGGPGFTPGRQAFMALASLSMAFCFFEGLRQTSDCLSGEKREGTLGLLFLTDLSGWDVVVGKLAATSIHSFYGLLAVFPVLAIVLSMGGVRGVEFWRMVLTLMNTLYFSLALGLWCSARCRDAYRAAVMSFLSLAVLVLGPLVLDVILGLLDRSPAEAVFALASPVFTATLTYDTGYLASPARYWVSLAIVHLLAWLFLWTAGRHVARHWQDEERPLWWMTWWRRARPGASHNSAGRASARALWLDSNPALWLVRHFQSADLWLWIPGVLAVLGIVFQLEAIAHAQPVPGPTTVRASTAAWSSGLASLTYLLFYLVVAARSARCLVELRAQGGLELLLCTPLTERQLVQGHWRVLRPLALKLAFIGALVQTHLTLTNLAINGTVSPELQLFLMTKLAAGISSFAMDLVALSWIAQWLALRSWGLTQVVFRAFLYVILLPGFGSIALQILRGGMMLGGFNPLAWTLGEILMVIKDLLFIAFARRQLLQRMRELASDSPRGAPPRPRWPFAAWRAA